MTTTPAPLKLQRRRLRRVLDAPQRWVRRRGFGIHSPFAFDFVRRVIASHCSYYCYERLASAARNSGYRAATLRLLFRIALFFRPATFAIAGPQSAAIAAALHEGVPAASQVNEATPADMLIVTGEVSERQLSATIHSGGTIVVLNLQANGAAAQTIWNATRRGMLFRGTSTAIFVARPHLPHQSFSLWI